jgi:cyclohexanecarboxylate-CoA ligase
MESVTELHENYVKAGYWRNENIYSYLLKAVERFPHKEAVVDHFQKLTYQELNEQVKKLAGGLLSLGVSKGDVVSFQLPNWIECAIIHQAVAKIGAVSNPIIPIYRYKEVNYIIKQSNTKVLIIPYKFRDFDYLEMTRLMIENGQIDSLEKVLVLDKYSENPALNLRNEIDFNHFLQNSQIDNNVAVINETDPALLLYTSGTTANPKGVLHSHNTLLHENRTIINLYDLKEDDAIFMPSPVTHITGLLYGLEMPFMIQGKVVFQDIWDSHKAIKTIIKENCTWTVGATPFLRGIVDSLSEDDRKRLRLKAFPCGGADVPPDLIKHASERLGCYVTRVYGSSEYPTLTGCNIQDSLYKAANTDGKLLEGSEAKIVDENGLNLSIGQVGELAVKGPEMFLGYTQKEYNIGSFLPDGYFLTGDLAVIDEDGYIEIKGRKKDIIIRNGENVSVKEVEELLYQHPNIKQVAIVAMPDPNTGEKACAFVVPKDDQSISLEEISKFLIEKQIAKQKLPERLEVISEMPMTASGKIQKFRLKETIKEKLTGF